MLDMDNKLRGGAQQVQSESSLKPPRGNASTNSKIG